jgi:hypothetical protein
VTAAEALALMLAMLPAGRPYRGCIDTRRASIVTQADAASREHGVPMRLLLAVGYAESHLGCAPRSGGCWGAPISRTARHTAGRASHAASALALGHRRCGTWRGAIAHFRCGRCVCAGSYVARVSWLAGGVE